MSSRTCRALQPRARSFSQQSTIRTFTARRTSERQSASERHAIVRRKQRKERELLLRGVRLHGLFPKVRANLDPTCAYGITNRASDPPAVRQHQALSRVHSVRDLRRKKTGDALRLGFERRPLDVVEVACCVLWRGSNAPRTRPGLRSISACAMRTTRCGQPVRGAARCAGVARSSFRSLALRGHVGAPLRCSRIESGAGQDYRSTPQVAAQMSLCWQFSNSAGLALMPERVHTKGRRSAL